MQNVAVNWIGSGLCDSRKISGINRHAAVRCGDVRFVVFHREAEHFAVN
jgi:hypothetical protein